MHFLYLVVVGQEKAIKSYLVVRDHGSTAPIGIWYRHTDANKFDLDIIGTREGRATTLNQKKKEKLIWVMERDHRKMI